MNKYVTSLILSIFTMLGVSTSTYSAPEKFTLDNQHTYILWNIKHLGFSTQSGKWYASGELVLDKEHPEQSKVDATIKMADIVTGIPQLDKHLKAKLFFDVEQFPKATFVSNKVQIIDNKSAKVEGTLTLHGISKPVTLDVTFNKAGVNPLTDRNTVGFMASTTIKRSDFGINALLPDLGDEVTLQIGAEAYQDKK